MIRYKLSTDAAVTRGVLLCTLAFSLCVSLSACGEQEQTLPLLVGETMGTSYRVTLGQYNPPQEIEQLRARIDERLDDLENRMSTYRPESDISRLNRAAPGEWVAVAPQMLEVGEHARRLHSDSGGAFDVTVGPLVNLWGFGPDRSADRLPSDSDIAEAMARVGMDNIEFRKSPSAIRKRRDSYLDYSAIAKGYGVDVVAHLLRKNGIGSYLVEIGGELVARGAKPDGQPWRVAIEQPTAGERSIAAIVRLGDSALATSGDYRNFVTRNGKRYSHTIDPRTGYPVEHDLRAVSVIAETCIEADALATALMVLGPKEGMSFADRHELAALFISGEPGAYNRVETERFSEYLEEIE